jgi:hypothetical protein
MWAWTMWWMPYSVGHVTFFVSIQLYDPMDHFPNIQVVASMPYEMHGDAVAMRLNLAESCALGVAMMIGIPSFGNHVGSTSTQPHVDSLHGLSSKRIG